MDDGATRGLRVLVADDERSQRFVLSQYLQAAGFQVVEATDGQEALAAIRGDAADAALIDIMMPGLDGFELVRIARQQSAIPILFVTARQEEAQRIVGLELGADDYITKPFSPAEVVARLRAHLRRAEGLLGRESLLRHGPIEADRETRRCYVRDAPVELTRREFDLLVALLERPGAVRTRSQLLSTVWGTEYLSEKTVDVHISALRRKLGDAFRVRSLRGIGYRLEQ